MERGVSESTDPIRRRLYPWRLGSQREPLWVMEADDVCASIWRCGVAMCWDVSGPDGIGTKGSGSVVVGEGEQRGLGGAQCRAMDEAKRRAEIFIAGYRAAKKEGA